MSVSGMRLRLTDLSLTLTQNQEQRLLRVVEISYSYTLHNSLDNTQFLTNIDILGEDVLRDQLLAQAVDKHETQCKPGEHHRTHRRLVVAQGLLDEDVGDDEIKLRVNVESLAVGHTTNTVPPTQTVVSALTPMVRGKF